MENLSAVSLSLGGGEESSEENRNGVSLDHGLVYVDEFKLPGHNTSILHYCPSTLSKPWHSLANALTLS
jgi:hypothetical protein